MLLTIPSSPVTFRPRLFLGAVAILILVRIYAFLAKRRGHPLFESAREVSVWSPYQLVVASFLTLFAELAFIRWIAVEIRVFAYFKNLAFLLLCFVGFGLGCALARQTIRWPVSVKALMGLLLVACPGTAEEHWKAFRKAWGPPLIWNFG